MLSLGYMPHGTGRGFPFDALFGGRTINVLERGFKDVGALVLWGGTDIASSYYGEKPHHNNQNMSGQPSQRDANEWKAMKYAKLNNIPIIGVCRGAQFMTVFAGGKLIQHCDSHHQSHKIHTEDGRSFESNSCHHQMMYPWDIQHHLMAWTQGLSTTYQNKAGLMHECFNHVEPEIVEYPQIRGLAIQGHPEWMGAETPFVKYCLELAEKLLVSEKEVETV